MSIKITKIGVDNHLIFVLHYLKYIKEVIKIKEAKVVKKLVTKRIIFCNRDIFIVKIKNVMQKASNVSCIIKDTYSSRNLILIGRS